MTVFYCVVKFQPRNFAEKPKDEATDLQFSCNFKTLDYASELIRGHGFIGLPRELVKIQYVFSEILTVNLFHNYHTVKIFYQQLQSRLSVKQITS